MEFDSGENRRSNTFRMIDDTKNYCLKKKERERERDREKERKETETLEEEIGANAGESRGRLHRE